MFNLTGDILRKIAPNIELSRANEIARMILEICPAYGINTADLFHEFLANLLHESGCFRLKAENLTYSTASRIIAVWPTRFSMNGTDGKKNANNYVKNPKLLANEVYNGRMGNKSGSDDGYNFRGAGFIQLTGRDTFQAFYNYKHGTGKLEDFANLIRTDDAHALESACWFFAAYKNLLRLAVGDNNFVPIVKAINGGTVGFEERKKFFDLAKLYIK